MKKYKKETRTTTQTYDVLVERVCDLCGKQGKSQDDWEAGFYAYDVKETEIKVVVRYKDGYNSPSGGSGTETNIDICPSCFKSKLIPWMESQGAKIESKDWYW